MQSSIALRNDADPFIEPLRDNELLINLIAEVSQNSRADVVRRFISEHHDPGTNVREALCRCGIEPYVWSDDLEAFYAATDAFLYESLVWNRTTLKNDMRRWIGAHLAGVSDAPQRILTFGDGLGLDAYYLATVGHHVTYFDVSRQCSTFAQRLFARDNLEIEMLADPTQIPREAFDAVVCLDVLEHVPDPVSLVGWLSALLRAGGRLIVHAPFSFLHPSVSTHLRCNQRFSGNLQLFTPFGLRPVDGCLFWNPIVLERQDRSSPRSVSRPPWRVVAGGGLLSLGRFWALPHATLARHLVRLSNRRLNEMVAELDAG
jgi:2-polyprenyl-3-methyl-5-hydroxy-6-metoxy-1,4-benzoquinol methylase